MSFITPYGTISNISFQRIISNIVLVSNSISHIISFRNYECYIEDKVVAKYWFDSNMSFLKWLKWENNKNQP